MVYNWFTARLPERDLFSKKDLRIILYGDEKVDDTVVRVYSWELVDDGQQVAEIIETGTAVSLVP